MNTPRFLAATCKIAKLSVNLGLGICLLTALPAVVGAAPKQPATTSAISNNAGAKNLGAGSRGPAVAELQQQLDRRGLFPYAKDGVYGSQTVRAVETFQRIRGLEPTGLADAETLDLLGIDLARFPTGFAHPNFGTLSTNFVSASSSPNDIRVLQRALSSYGFNLSADGVYGSQTINAVRAYQRTANLLPVDNFADQAMLNQMGFFPTNSNGDIVANSNFDGGGFGGSNGSVSRSDRDQEAGYVAAIIAEPSELGRVRSLVSSTATLGSNRQGDYISLGRFRERSDADVWVERARARGYESRVLWD